MLETGEPRAYLLWRSDEWNDVMRVRIFCKLKATISPRSGLLRAKRSAGAESKGAVRGTVACGDSRAVARRASTIPLSLVLMLGNTVTYFCQAAGASRLAAILVRRA
jgi:hypothetical protein